MELNRAVALAVLFAVSFPLHAAPTITSVSGEAVAGAEVVVSGSGFGNGPNVILFDDFEGGQVGAQIPLTSPKVGSWSRSDRPQLYDSIARSGRSSARIYGGGRPLVMTKTFPEPATEVFFSFWVQVPPGTNFPGNVGGPRQYSSDSSWKFTWLVDSSIDGSSSDLCLPTHAGTGSFALGGNDMSLGYISSSWWDWDTWIRVTTYLKADPTQPTSAGTYWFHAISEGEVPYVKSESKAVFDSDGPSTKVWRYISFPGWLRWDSDTRPVYDDVYVAVGANARARVELGNAATYAQSRTLVLLTPTNWTASTVKAKVWNTESEDKTWYVYVTDGNGNVNSAGYPLTSAARPNPPVLDVQ